MTSLIFFSKWEATIPIRLFDRAYFSGLQKSSLSRDYIKKICKLIKNEINLILIITSK
jgi:hypothetical protein